MGGIVDFAQDFIGGITGSTAADAATQASQLNADAIREGSAAQQQYQQQALDYMMQREQLPRQFSEGALTQMGGLYGLEGGDPNAMANLQQTPMYQAIMSGVPASEEAILRNAGATGGFRSGGVQQNLAENIQGLQNQALYSSMEGLQGLSNLPSGAGNIANMMGNIGSTVGSGIYGAGQSLAQGVTGAAQATQAGMGNLMNTGMGIGSMLAFSDIRLKSNVEFVGDAYGHNWYSWDWNDNAKELGLSGKGEGVMAHEVAEIIPDAITTNGDYLIVDYSKLTRTH